MAKSASGINTAELMGPLDFFDAPAPMTLAALAADYGATLPEGVDPAREFRPAWPLDRAGRGDVAFCFDPGEIDDLIATRAGACFVSPQAHAKVPATTIALLTDDPLDAFRRMSVALQSKAIALRPLDPAAIVHVEASLEQGVVIEPGVVIGPHVEIGAATVIGASSVIGAGVRIGRGCRIDSHVSIRHALVGDRVSIQAGARIGTAAPERDAPGSGPAPRLGRVIIQDDVEIGPNAVVDRGRTRDTMIGDHVRIGALTFVEGGLTIDRCRVLDADIFSRRREIG